MNNLIVSMACITVVIIAMINLLENEMIPKEKKEQFDLLGLLIILEIIIDVAIFYSDEKFLFNRIGYNALRATEYCISPVVAMLLAKLMARQSFWKKIRRLFVILIGINAICQIYTFLLPIVIHSDEEMKCDRAPYTCTYIVILIVCIVLLVILANNTIIQSYTRVSYTLILTSVLLSAGIIVKGMFPNTNADWLCITFCYLIFMVYICNSYLKIDSLTTLLNRRAFDNKITSVNYNTAIIVIDANNFKSINDNYGHQSGDMALVKISEIIYTVYGKVGFCYRTGGDEFCIIIKKGILKKMTVQGEHTDSHSFLENITKSLNEKIRIEAIKNPILKNGVAQGYCIYNSKQEEANKSELQSDDINEVYTIADKRMYIDKEKRKHTV